MKQTPRVTSPRNGRIPGSVIAALCVLAALGLSSGLSTRVQAGRADSKRPNVQAPISDRREQSNTGTHHVVAPKGTVNFAELARRPTSPAAHKEIDAPLAGPHNLPVPDHVIIQNPKVGRGRPPMDGPHKIEPAVASPTPSSSFPALEDDQTDSGLEYPPDTQGAAGPDNLMVTLNSEVRIQSRDGSNLSTVTLDNFWQSTSIVEAFDPKLIYDPYENRWVFAALSDQKQATSSVLLAVSSSSDPTANWTLYKIKADDSSLGWADYPSIGFNGNWIVVSVNMYDFAAAPKFQSAKIFLLNKAELYAEGAIHPTFFQDTAGAPTVVPALTYDAAQATMYLITTWNGNSEGNGFIRISTITGPVGQEVFTPGVAFASTHSPWDSGGSIINLAPQFGSPDLINAGDDRMLKVVYRNGSLWCTHTVFLPSGGPTYCAVQYWELAPDGTVRQLSRIGEGNTPCAYPSMAVNSNNDVLIGYSYFSAQGYASAGYNYRAGGDAPSSLRDGVTLKAGEAPYFTPDPAKDNKNRWGDYSNAVVDPANDSDFWMIQEYAATPANHWGTWWGMVVPDESQQGSAPVITDLTARLSGDVLTLTGTATDSTGDMTQADVALLNGDGSVVGDTQPFQYGFGSAAVANFTITVTHMASVPDAVAGRLTVIDQQGNKSVPATADFSQPDPGGPTITNAGYDSGSGILTIRGPGFGNLLQLETNGTIVAPPLRIKIKGGGIKLKIVGSTSDLNLQSGPNRIVIVDGGLRSNIFVLSL